ncbi:MAG: histidine kinase [Clostridiaceae bacterium]|nr:histidine kinase [Clostridiaceae bacterium]
MKKTRFFSIRKSIRNRIFYSSMLIMTLLAFALSVRSYQVSVNILQEKVSDTLLETLGYVGNSVERVLLQVEQVSDFIFTNVNIRRILEKKELTESERLENVDRMDEILTNYSMSSIFNFIPAIRIFGKNGEEYSFGKEVYELDSKKIKELDMDKVLEATNAPLMWTGIHEAFLQQPFQKKYTISLFRLIKDEKYNEITGFLYMSLEPALFESMLKEVNLQNKSEIYITDNEDRIIFHSEQKNQYADIKSVLGSLQKKDESDVYISDNIGGSKLVSIYTIEPYNWKVYGTIPVDTLISDSDKIIINSFVIFALIFILACIVWYFILTKITKPLKELANTMSSVDEGNMYVKYESEREDEIGLVANSFNYMMDKMHNLFDNLLDEQYKVLQSQINPHFLYNTLNSIRWMAIIHGANNIKDVIDALSRLIMKSMNNNGQFTTVDEEISSLKDYIYIQKIRYNNSFDVEFNIDNEVLKCECIRFILQPQVENAIFHGLEPKEGFGLIRVTARLKEEHIYFEIWDNGVGMSEEQIFSLLTEEKEKDRGLSGIGVRNVNERIKMIYGKQYGIQITSRIGEYTCVKITIPNKIKSMELAGTDEFSKEEKDV